MSDLPRQRRIIHLDADAFFASVEQASDSRLRGKAIAVGGEKRGIIASASYEARKLGIYTPMPTALARRLCPRLIVLPGDFEKYELFSRLMFSYAYDFTPDVEIGSIDEGYFDLTGSPQPSLKVADTIRCAINQSLKLPVSEGIGSNKLISQIASKLQKPCAFQHVPDGSEARFLAPLANKWLPGVGPKTARQLLSAGLARIGQIAATPPDLLGLLVGNQAEQLCQFARGIDARPVVPARAPAKSFSEQETFATDTTDEPFVEATLRRMADRLMAQIRAENKCIRTLTVKVRYNDMDEAQCAESLAEPTDLETDLYGRVHHLLRKAWTRRVSLRLVSLKLSNLYDGRFSGGLVLDVPSRQHEARERLADVVDALRQKHGPKAVFRGHDFILRSREGKAREPEAPRPEPPAMELREAPPQSYGAAAVQPQRPASPIALKLSNGVKDSVQAPGSRLHAPRGRQPVCLPLNVHSYYSFLDSTLPVRSLIQWAVQQQIPALALTDTHNLHGAVEFATEAARAGIKPIIGAEIVQDRHRVCLYVENTVGYHNLCRILSRLNSRPAATGRADEEEPGGHPLPAPAVRRTEELFASTDGLLAISAHPDFARFFPRRFYQGIGSEDDLRRRDDRLPGVVWMPVHYEQPGDRWKFDVVQSIRTLTLLRQPHPGKRLGGGCHFPLPGELDRLFGGHPDLIDHTRELAARCDFQFTLGKPQFPRFKPAEGSPAALLRQLALDGLRRRYPRDHARLRPQIEEELGIITDVGYEEYFLVMWDILQECRRRGIEWITRGSAADSLVCYCLEISGVCPIRFDLYFRRFLNKDRMALNKLPDIDVDFPHDRKDDVVDLVFEKYGPGHTALVGGFSTFQARSAFAEVAKVLGVSDHQARRITERFPYYTHAAGLREAVQSSRECHDLPLTQEPFSTAVEMGRFLDGFPRYPKMHPCGLVLSRQPMHELTPCFTSAKGYPTTHFDMDSVEAIGLVKMDILAQGGLAVMRDARELIAREERLDPIQTAARGAVAPGFDLNRLEPWQDPEVWKLIASGGARAVHHIESPAMISLCKMCNVRDIDTLVAIVSVIRPGAANESKKQEFALRYQGIHPIVYPHPSLEACLRGTFGLVVYEEHILQMCEAFAGLPPGRADILRRALGKEKLEVIEEVRREFQACARRLGRPEAGIEEVWKLVDGFRGYAFCKAHSTAYGVEAYQSAWLKRYFPAEFMAAVLANGKGFYQPLVYILECHRLGVRLLPPSINQPGPAFGVESGAIRVPALRAKGLSHRTVDRIVAERARRPFASLADCFLRCQPAPEEMDILIRAGAFDEFQTPRTRQVWEFRSLCKSMDAAGQLWLMPPGNLDHLPEAPLTEPERIERLRMEQELFGYPVSGHPLELFPEVAWDTYCPVNRLDNHIGQRIVTCGLVIEQRIHHQSTGEPMKFMTIADWTGVVETELFARTYQAYGANTIRYPVLDVEATVEPYANSRGYSLRVWRAGSPRTKSCGDC